LGIDIALLLSKLGESNGAVMQQKSETQSVVLENAFNTFNNLSAQLAQSYQALEQRVEKLTAELNQVRSERIKQLSEKECLASRISQLLELLPGGVVVLDGEGIITECNPAAIKLLGRPLIDLHWHKIISRAFSPDLDDGSEVNLKNGKRVSIVSQSLGLEPGQIILVTDVTEQHALQSLLNRHYKLSAMGEMAASLAHQIRTPLSTALLYISHLNRISLSDEDRMRTLDKVVSRLRYLDHMVNDMLQFARSGTYEMDCISMEQIIEGLLLSIEPQISAKNGEIIVFGKYRKLFLYGNSDALQGALLNIVTNAVQVIGEKVKIEIKISNTRSGNIRLTIKDNGPGIEKDVIPNLFTPFFTSRPDGTGLGLAVAHTIIEAHKGKIDVHSKLGQGASFIIELPKVREKDLISAAVKSTKSLSFSLPDVKAS